jgi:hypothetical protein
LKEQGTETAVEVVSVRVGEDGRWIVSVLSDGGAVVSREDGKGIGATAGVGVSGGPLELGVKATSELAGRSARSWRFTNLGRAKRFLRLAQRDPGLPDRVPPDERWSSFGSRGELSAEAEVPLGGRVPGRRTSAGGGRDGARTAPASGASAGIDVAMDGELAGAGAGYETAIGRRTGGGRTTLFFRSELGEAKVFAGLPAWGAATPSREALVELTRDRGGLRELVVRTAVEGAGRREETIARLDLRDPEIRARLGGGGPSRAGALRDAASLAVTHGVVERQVYAVDDRSDSFAISGRIGVALGYERTSVDVRKRLTDAAVWIAGSGPRRRADCLGLA